MAKSNVIWDRRIYQLNGQLNDAEIALADSDN
jgi:hypothetical protein